MYKFCIFNNFFLNLKETVVTFINYFWLNYENLNKKIKFWFFAKNKLTIVLVTVEYTFMLVYLNKFLSSTSI